MLTTKPDIQVRNVSHIISDTKIYLRKRVEKFRAGSLKYYLSNWENLTSDKEILSYVSGVKIDFTGEPNLGSNCIEAKFNQNQSKQIDQEIKLMLAKGIIRECDTAYPEYISRIFTRPKSDGSVRLILNLKNLNQYVQYHHFKMDTLYTVINLMEKGCYMASIDLKDAYYTVGVDSYYQNFLKFKKGNKLYAFTCMPNGLSSAPRIFTKLLKPPLAELRTRGFINSPYIDDIYLQASNFDKCFQNVLETSKLMDKLGFVTHPDKSQLMPQQEIIFLGFKLNSKNMTVQLPPEKSLKMSQACRVLLAQNTPLIREVAKLIGLLVASFPGVQYGPLFYRSLEYDKNKALINSKGNYDEVMKLSLEAIADLEWWVDNITSSFRTISSDKIGAVLYTDASKTGWGAVLEDTKTSGGWTEFEKDQHINYLELKAVYFGLKALCAKSKCKHIRLMSDNTTAVHNINNMGTIKSKLYNALVKDIWKWAIKKGVWLSAAHIPGKHNILADAESRTKDSSAEWMLNRNLYVHLTTCLKFQPKIDLFASRINYQISKYVAYKPDPGAWAIDAFSLDWSFLDFYAFPPFSVINKVLQKIIQEEATGIVIVPQWPTQVWYPKFLALLTTQPVTLFHSQDLLIMPGRTEEIHPLHKKLNLMAGLLSGNKKLQINCQQGLLR